MKLLTRFISEIQIIKIELLTAAVNEISESGIELVLRRRLYLEPEPTVFVQPPISELVGAAERGNSGW
jgi:hypothetical protein